MASVVGYSDRVNHALAFAAKHHDKQVRKGTSLPYLTHPANVAIILTRFDCDLDTVVAGILHDVIEDSVRDGHTREDLEERIGAKFGSDVLATALAVTERRIDDEGVDLSPEERKDDYLERLDRAPESARWVCAADQLHNSNGILADLKRTSFPETVWGRYNRGPDATAEWYRRVYERLSEVGFRAPIMDELNRAVMALEEEAARAPVAP
jgi:(p)ppGpp synthase/HD superfamily hydrolase